MTDREFPHSNLIGIDQLDPSDIVCILDEAEIWAETNANRIRFPAQANLSNQRLAGLTIINAFFEDSTRTKLSFEIAGKRLGADVINMTAATSSIRKGETLLDTALTLNAMRADVIIIRHQQSGAVELISGKTESCVINAGDGRHEHPTQALLDALTIRKRKGKIAGLRIAICGDILHSRVARSNIRLLSAMGAEVRVVAPPTLLPVKADHLGASVFLRMDEGIKDADVIMVLRLQKERMNGSHLPSSQEYFKLYGLTIKRLELAKPDVLVMHPGPMNRGIEIDGDVADDLTYSAIAQQVEMGVAVRMACLDLLTRNRRQLHSKEEKRAKGEKGGAT